MTPTRIFPGLLLAAAMAAPAAAQDAAPAKKWKDAAEGSVVATNGNTKTRTISLKNLFTYAFTPATSFELDFGALTAKNQGKATAEEFYASDRLTRKLDDRNFAFGRHRWDRNRFAGIQHRNEFSVGGGRELWKTAKDLWTAEGGPSYVVEERFGERRRDYAAARAFTKYGHDFSASVKFGQTAEYLISLEDARDNRLTTETSFVSALSTVFSVKTSFLWKHVGQPPPGAVKDDTTTSFALIASF